MKGRAYASELGPNHVDRFIGYVNEPFKPIFGSSRQVRDGGERVPWGRYLPSLILHEEFAFDSNQIVEVIVRLRSYTARYLPSAIKRAFTTSKSRDYLSAFPRESHDYVSKVAGVLGLAAVSPIDAQVTTKVMELIVAVLGLLPSSTKDQINESISNIRMLTHQSTIEAIVNAEDEVN